MQKKSKINKLLKWIFKIHQSSIIGYKNNDTNSVNSLSILIDMNNTNMKVIENQFIDKQINQIKLKTRKRRWINFSKSIDYTVNYLDHQQLNTTKTLKRKFIIKNDNYLDYQMNSKEEYLNKFWIPTKSIDKLNKETVNQIDMLNLKNQNMNLNFDDNFVNEFNLNDKSKNQIYKSTKESNIVNLLIEKECSICENELNSPDELMPLELLPCNCIFHLYCISSHLNLKKFCPFCLKNFSKKQILNFKNQWKSRHWLS